MRQKVTLATLANIIENIKQNAPEKNLEDFAIDMQITNGYTSSVAPAITTMVYLRLNKVVLFGGTKVPGEEVQNG